ncbi:MAG TPA: MoxR family ATPase, partial [Acidimicrobiales bacterium]
ADITGTYVLSPRDGTFSLRAGPIFANVVLADEINRASPKTQSALLEAMEERQVTVDVHTYRLPRPFMVIATQNPFDAAGTFPLPHSQRDRFLLRLDLGYPDRETEDLLLSSMATRPTPEQLSPVGGPEFLRAFAATIDATYMAPEVRGYVLDIIHATRNHPDLTVGASPRAGLSVVRAAAAFAVTRGRTYVTPDDIKLIAEPTLAHRLQAHPAAELAGATTSATVFDILSRLPVPVGASR